MATSRTSPTARGRSAGASTPAHAIASTRNQRFPVELLDPALTGRQLACRAAFGRARCLTSHQPRKGLWSRHQLSAYLHPAEHGAPGRDMMSAGSEADERGDAMEVSMTVNGRRQEHDVEPRLL